MAAMTIASENLLLLLSVLVIFTSLATSQPDFVHYLCKDNNGNNTANSTYSSNLNTLLSNLSSIIGTSNNYQFYNVSNGKSTDKVNLIWMCRGDVTKDHCLSCLNDSRILLPNVCPNQKEATGWYDYCMLRYSNRSIFGIMDSNWWAIHNNMHVNNVNEFNQVTADLMQSLRSKAAAISGDSQVKFAAGNASVAAGFEHVYAHVQCTNDLSELECNDCLAERISTIPDCCNGTVRVRIFTPSCNLRYDTTPYFDSLSVLSPQSSLSPAPSSTTATATLKQGKSNSSSTTVIAIVVPVVSLIILLLITFVCIYFRRKKKPTKYFETQGESEADYEIEPIETLQFDFQTIMDATNNFSVANKLGEGGFGIVYKGRLPNGEEVAIKRLSRNSEQGDIEFKNELLLVAKLQHRNLARLLGFCLEIGERILVYEFLPNKSLDYFIFDPVKRLLLDWEVRYKIIEGIARGLLYLHEDSQLRIIHRDLKASNILLDEKMNAKISDFGMARLFIENQTRGSTLRVVGTHGYMAPEYALHGHFSIKSDVFSFGVLLLEIVSGHKNGDIHNGEYVEHLISFTWKKWMEGSDSASDIVDQTFYSSRFRNEITRCIHIGLLCVQENVADRPTMATVVMMLNSESVILPIPSKAAYVTMNNAGDLSNGRRLGESGNYALQTSSGANEASITDPHPR
ncbi:cysteine-rich receptor-like protein kinase 29 [Arachis hypogaea]|uniref:Cysteine-rich receptor-like protein kinase n=1 Tax=Arachis hypogaea TaxID=3818 RepID=A0A445BFA0_ARAHY|nr:putative receptor-like protein kinase At4g00960 [Arachis hypogaea]QHO35857.1 Cysteine-rich receptor-like protein kinase [Arachis hypogaea]RYR37358.1 hypothetical protein Ahy_A09g042261 [Arachis hypogaea]